MIIEPIQYACDFIKKMAAVHAPNAKAYAMFQVYDADPIKYPVLRDRTDEMVPAVKAMAATNQHVAVIMKGHEMYKPFEFNAVGAQYAQTFRIIFA